MEREQIVRMNLGGKRASRLTKPDRECLALFLAVLDEVAEKYGREVTIVDVGTRARVARPFRMKSSTRSSTGSGSKRRRS